MITNTGKAILGKYLIGQASAYASHIAIGCGAKPLSTIDLFGDYSSKTELDFEMIRVPIISRGYILDGDTTKIAFTAELPTTNRYDITEIGVYSGNGNSLAQGSDSRMLYTFTSDENWEYHNQSGSASVTAPTITISTNSIIDKNNLSKSFLISSRDLLFVNEDRQLTLSKPRFLDNSIMIRTDTSYVVPNATTGEFEIDETYTDGHIHITGQSVSLDNNTANDELKLAFSVIPVDQDVPVPDELYVVIQFTSSESVASGFEYAKMQIKLTSADFEDGNYFVKTVKLGGSKTGSYYTDALYKTSQFSWSQVTTLKVYASASIADSSSDPDLTDGFYVALDGLKFENITSTEANPLYGLTAYSPVVNDFDAETTTGYPIEKTINSNNLIEFRFGFDVGVTS